MHSWILQEYKHQFHLISLTIVFIKGDDAADTHSFRCILALAALQTAFYGKDHTASVGSVRQLCDYFEVNRTTSLDCAACFDYKDIIFLSSIEGLTTNITSHHNLPNTSTLQSTTQHYRQKLVTTTTMKLNPGLIPFMALLTAVRADFDIYHVEESTGGLGENIAGYKVLDADADVDCSQVNSQFFFRRDSDVSGSKYGVSCDSDNSECRGAGNPEGIVKMEMNFGDDKVHWSEYFTIVGIVTAVTKVMLQPSTETEIGECTT